MTPLPTIERRRVERAEAGWPPVPRRGTCAHPRCHGASEQRHHAVARGVLFGPFDYIYIDDERVINVIDLCAAHHDQLESKPGGCNARLRWMDALEWIWYDRHKVVDAKERIYWTDPKSNTIWVLVGPLKGEYSCVSNANNGSSH